MPQKKEVDLEKQARQILNQQKGGGGGAIRTGNDEIPVIEIPIMMGPGDQLYGKIGGSNKPLTEDMVTGGQYSFSPEHIKEFGPALQQLGFQSPAPEGPPPDAPVDTGKPQGSLLDAIRAPQGPAPQLMQAIRGPFV